MKLTRRQLLTSSALAFAGLKPAAKSEPFKFRLRDTKPKGPVHGDIYHNDTVGRTFFFDGAKWLEVLP